MSALKVFTSRSMEHEVKDPKHGQPGWRLSQDGVLEEVIYCLHDCQNQVRGWKTGWVSVDEYRTQKKRLYDANLKFAEEHPHVIRQIIESKRAIHGRRCIESLSR